MILFLNRNSSALIILYSTLLLLTFELLLAKISPQIYSVFNPLPFLFLGLIIQLRHLFLSLILSLLLLISTNIFFENFFQKQLIIFHLIISAIILIFFSSCYLARKINLTSSNLIALLNVFFLITFTFLYIFLFNDIAQKELHSFIKKTIEQIISNYNIQKNPNIDKLIEIFMLILPSINSLIFFITFSFNYILAKILVSKFDINQNQIINLDQFTTPLWFSFFYLVLIIFLSLSETSSPKFITAVNSIICMSFCYILEGFNSLKSFFEKIQINVFLKFIIIFLLFIFLGYVLLLIILFLGYFENIKSNIKKKS